MKVDPGAPPPVGDHLLHWQRLRENGQRWLIHLIGTSLVVWIALTYVYGNLAIPVRFVMLRSGIIGLLFLVASFACTPLSHLLQQRWVVPLRRLLGLYGFLFVGVHLFAYAVLENQLALELIWRDLLERRAMSVGLVSFGLLAPLAFTSTRGWQRRLGKKWKRLHRIVYLATPLAVLHFYWLDRDFKEVPLVFAGIVAFLLGLRTPPVKQALARLRQRLFAAAGENL